MNNNPHIYPEDWRTLQRIADGSKITEFADPTFGPSGKGFTVGKGRVHWNCSILDALAAHGYLNRGTNTVTGEGLVALIYRQVMKS